LTPVWSRTYFDTLLERFATVVDGLDRRLDDVVAGRVAPAVDDIEIGSGRSVRAGVMFFDLVGFSSRTSSSDVDDLKQTLYMLDCVIPTMMGIVFDYGGYVEKNTGDGVLAIFGVAEADESIARTTLEVGMSWLYALEHIVNPWLAARGLEAVEARVTIDLGTLLLARIGMPKGRANHDRSFLTAVGPPANLASKLQDYAGAGQIYTGHLIQRNAPAAWQGWFFDRTPHDWIWIWIGGPTAGQSYRAWEYTGRWNPPG